MSKSGAGGASVMRIRTVDYHTAGEPFRIVTQGVPRLEGKGILAKRRFAAENLDDIRKLLVFEPRGHADMYGCFVTEPDDPDGHLGVVFFHNAGYSTACGHGTIALVTWAIDSGIVTPADDRAEVVVDVPSGRLRCDVRISDGKVVSVAFRNVPSYVHSRALAVSTSKGSVVCDISYGGAFYASVAAADVGLRVRPSDLPALIELGREIKAGVESAVEVVHPEEPELHGVYGVIFHEPDEDPDHPAQRNVTIFADGEVDRSPCGSGTSARLALLDDSGELPRGETLVHRSIIGSRFTGRVVGTARVGDVPGVVTEVAGRAFHTGIHDFVLDPEDPVGLGFLLR